MSQQPPPREPLVGEIRFRVPLPIVIPLVALVIIGAFVIGFAWVLLSIPTEAATVIAIAMAANVLGVCAFLALRSRVSSSTIFELMAILIYPILIGIVIANIGLGEEEHAAAEGASAEGEAPAPAAGGTVVVAENTAFDVTEIEIKAQAENTITLDNRDPLDHNISIYPDQQAGLGFENAIFEGDIVAGPGTIDYTFEGPEKGEYHFQCDVHPNMNGSVIAR
ncbi:MAG: cupredoxin domain-containing protein [Actinomycetota bacterium]